MKQVNAIVVHCLVLTVFTTYWILPAHGKGLAATGMRSTLRGRSQSLSNQQDANLEVALQEILGHRSNVSEPLGQQMRTLLQPVWDSLPKNSMRRIGWEQLRYMVYRYFMKKENFQIRGFEPTVRFNSKSINRNLGILQDHMPELAASLKNNAFEIGGFDFDDVMSMIVTLDAIVREYERNELITSYSRTHFSTKTALTKNETISVIRTHMINWILADEPDLDVDALFKDPSMMAVVIPTWHDIESFIAGSMTSKEYHLHIGKENRPRFIGESATFCFDSVYSIVTELTRGFARFWGSECKKIKHSLSLLDKTGTGRVPIHDFYKSALDGTWQFGESEQYLRDFGAIDDSVVHSPKIIIPNYVQSTSNCVSRSNHYHSCCTNECDAILEEFEHAIGAPAATPEKIIDTIRGMTEIDGIPIKVTSSMVEKLRIIAQKHSRGLEDGKVPVHGRLFAQWLHYIFPLECPMPLKIEVHQNSLKSPGEYGAHYFADWKSLQKYKVPVPEINETINFEIDFGQWTEDGDEVIGGSVIDLRAPWEEVSKSNMWIGFGAIILLSLSLSKVLRGSEPDSGKSWLPTAGKIHNL